MSEEEAGIQEESPDMTDVEVEETDGGGGVNYHDRIQSEPEFALGEVKKKDSYIGQLHEKQTKYKSLEPYVDAVGGEELARLAGIGQQIETNPTLKQALQNALNGVPSQPPPKQEEEEDEIYDPEIKALDARYRSLFEEQSSVIQDLQNRLNKTEAVGLTSSLQDNMEQALSLFKDDPDSLAEAQAEISKSVKHLEQAAKNGDRAAAKQLEDLGSPTGARTLRMMQFDIYQKSVEKKLEQASNQKTNGEVIRNKATDTPATTRAAMPLDTIGIESGRKVTSQLVADVMAKAAKKLGKDPDSLFR